MAKLVEWNDTCSKSNKSYDSDEFLRVKPDCKLKVRLVGELVKIVKIFTNDKKCIAVVNEDVGNQLMEKYPGKISNVNVRYACWCFDRYGDEMKILEMPKSVARGMGNRVTLLGKTISGTEEGCDWAITTNGKKGKDVRYNVVYLEETPLSEQEKDTVEFRMLDKDSFDLSKVFVSYSFEEAEKKLLEM